MKHRFLQSRDGRAIKWGSAVLGVLLAVRFLIVPLVGAYVTARDALHYETDLLAREREVLREAQSFPARFGELGSGYLERAVRLLPGASASDAQAALAARIDALALNAGVRVSRVNPLPLQPYGTGLLAVGLQADADGTLTELLRLIAALEGGPVLLRVSVLELESRRTGSPAFQASQEAVSPLAMRVTVVGYFGGSTAAISPQGRGSDLP